MKKKNVLAKVIIPKLLLSIRYIAVELEEAEREETFRLKRVKQKKDREQYLLAEIIEGELREGTEGKKPADIKKEQTGQSIQPKAEPVAPKSPPLAPVPVAEMGDLAIIMPPGDITDPGDVFIPPREYATLEPINEIEELIDEQVSSEILDDADTIDESIKFGESFETGEWFETPSEDYRVTRVVQGKEEKIDLTLSESKADELSRTTEVDEPPDSDKSSASNKQIDGDDIAVKDDPDVLKDQLLEDLTSILEIVDTAREYSFISTPEKYDESISSLENPTIKFRETAEALSFSVVDTHDDDIEHTDTLESEQVEQDLFQPLRSDSEKEATTSILKQTSNYDQPASKDKSNDYERKDIDITEDILDKVALENPIDLNPNPTDGKNSFQTDTEAETFKTEQLVNEDNKSIEVTESMHNEPSDHKNKILNAVADEEIKVDANANEIKDHSEDIEVKIHESREQSSKEEAQKTIDESKEDKEGEEMEKANNDAKQTMNRPLRILSSDEILEQERLRNAQTEDEKESEKPDK